jgi:hypothetical protein
MTGYRFSKHVESPEEMDGENLSANRACSKKDLRNGKITK